MIDELSSQLADECVDAALEGTIGRAFTNRYYRVVSDATVRRTKELTSKRYQSLKPGMVVFATQYAINSTGNDRFFVFSEDREDRIGWCSPFSQGEDPVQILGES